MIEKTKIDALKIGDKIKWRHHTMGWSVVTIQHQGHLDQIREFPNSFQAILKEEENLGN